MKQLLSTSAAAGSKMVPLSPREESNLGGLPPEAAPKGTSSSSATLQANPASADVIFASLRASAWKTFRFEHGSYLLHVPSSTVVETPDEVLDHLSGTVVTASIQERLDELAAQLPIPERLRHKVDIQALSLNMAQDCNLRCTYCFAGDNANYGKKGLMTLATATAAIATFATGKEHFSLSFFGGEPLLNFETIQKIVAWCEAQTTRFNFSITTNGTLLNEEKRAWLRDKKFRVVLSYDGKGLQDKQRPLLDRKTSSRTLLERKLDAFGERLDELRSLNLRTTIEKGNLELLEASIVETLNSRSYPLTIAPHATPVRKLAFNEADVETLAGVYRRVVDRLLASGDYKALLRLAPLANHIKKISRRSTGAMTCGAGINYLTVSTAGEFYLCHRFNEDPSENLGGISSGFDRERAEKFAQFRHERPDPCGSCWMREWCAGGCFHENKSQTNDTLRVNPVFCKLLALETEEAMRVYTLLRDKAPHIFED